MLGKYRYRMNSPADNTSVPVIIDIILVGRTKIITLHSGVYVENGIDREISFRLHIPTTPLVPPPSGAAASGRGRREGDDGDVMVGPLAPGTGCYLPLTAVLGGSLFLRAEGFMEAQRDVIRLTPALGTLSGQQGYLSCEAAPLGRERFALHVALQAVPAKVRLGYALFFVGSAWDRRVLKLCLLPCHSWCLSSSPLSTWSAWPPAASSAPATPWR